MKQQFVIRSGAGSITLLFAGWGMDCKPFERYRPQDSDFMVCYDYTDLDFDASLINGYESVRIVGWSLGVWAAGAVADKILPRTFGIAINGTAWPLDEKRGIPPAVFYGTLRGLSPQSLSKFRRRMCGSAELLERFMTVEPARDLEDLRSELAAIADASQTRPGAAGIWNEAYVGKRDLIFPAENQIRAWEQAHVTCRLSDAAHYSEDIFEEALR